MYFNFYVFIEDGLFIKKCDEVMFNLLDIDICDFGKKFVMLFFYGGFYMEGIGNMFDGLVLVVYGNVIVVMFNYCFGVFGFFSIGD